MGRGYRIFGSAASEGRASVKNLLGKRLAYHGGETKANGGDLPRGVFSFPVIYLT